MDAVSRILPNGKGGSGSFITGRQMNQVTRSRYGRRLPVNVIRDLRTQNLLRFRPGELSKAMYFSLFFLLRFYHSRPGEETLFRE